MAQDWRGKGGYNLDDEHDEDSLEIMEEGYGKYRQPDAEDPQLKKARLRKAGIQFRVLAAFLLVAVGILLYGAFTSGEDTEEQKLNQIASLEDASYLFASEDTTAVGMIRRRFGEPGRTLPFTEGVVARYLFLQHPVEIWVGVATLQESAAEALSLLLEWTDPATNPEWRTQSQFTRGNTTVTQVVGHGQRNYFYRNSNMIVWITADSIAATHALQATLNTNLRDWIDQVSQGR